jgi:hypothetical protein
MMKKPTPPDRWKQVDPETERLLEALQSAVLYMLESQRGALVAQALNFSSQATQVRFGTVQLPHGASHQDTADRLDEAASKLRAEAAKFRGHEILINCTDCEESEAVAADFEAALNVTLNFEQGAGPSAAQLAQAVLHLTAADFSS